MALSQCAVLVAFSEPQAGMGVGGGFLGPGFPGHKLQRGGTVQADWVGPQGPTWEGVREAGLGRGRH